MAFNAPQVKRKFGYGELEEGIDLTDPMDDFGAAFRGEQEPEDPPPDVEIEVEGPPVVRAEAPQAPPLPPVRAPAPPPSSSGPKAAPFFFGGGKFAPFANIPKPAAGPVPDGAAPRAPLQPSAIESFPGGVGALAARIAAGKPSAAVDELRGAQEEDRRMGHLDAGLEQLRSIFTREAPRNLARGPGAVDRMLQNRALADDEAAKAKTARLEASALSDSDPNSPASESMRAFAQKAYGKFLDPELLKGMSKAQIEKALPGLKDAYVKQLGLEAETARLKTAREQRLADLGTARENKLADDASRRSQELADAARRREQKLTDDTAARAYQGERDTRLDGTRMERAKVIAGAKVDAEDRKVVREQEGKDKRNRVRGYELDPTFDPGDAEVAKLHTAQGEKDTMQATVREIADLYRQFGTEVLPGEAQARMRALVRNLQLQAKGESMFKLGVLAGPDLMLLEELVPNPTTTKASFLDFFGGNQILPTLEVFSKQADLNFENAAKARGYNKVGTGLPPEKKKRLEELKEKKRKEEQAKNAGSPAGGTP